MNLNGRPTNPGDLRTQVIIKTRTTTADANGFMVPAWSTLATLWAKWSNVHGSEVWVANAEGAEGAATVTIRYNSSIETTCAVELAGKLYEIVSVDDVMNRHEYMELKVRRMKAG